MEILIKRGEDKIKITADSDLDIDEMKDILITLLVWYGYHIDTIKEIIND